MNLFKKIMPKVKKETKKVTKRVKKVEVVDAPTVDRPYDASDERDNAKEE